MNHTQTKAMATTKGLFSLLRLTLLKKNNIKIVRKNIKVVRFIMIFIEETKHQQLNMQVYLVVRK